jgi:hypothetical protein
MKDIYCVIGMGRSGTALTCQVLEALGVSFGKRENLVGASDFNTRGHYDHAPTHELNIEILERLFNITWLFLGQLPTHWHKWDEVERFKDKAVRLLTEDLEYARDTQGRRTLSGRSPLGVLAIKDPRITRMRPFWEDVFARLELTPHYVLCWRHPDQVYLSCHPKKLRRPIEKKNGMVEGALPFEKPQHPNIHRGDLFAIWAQYMAEGFEAKPEAIVQYENWFMRGHGGEQANQLADMLGTERLTTEQLDKIIDPKMRHYGT